MSGKFRVDEFSLQAQRHIYPLYRKDGRGGYEFSSTMTFVKIKELYFCVFAAHALTLREDQLSEIGALKTDGSFMSLSDVSYFYKICRERDLCICATNEFEYKNYFDLDHESTTEFVDDFGWIGFPKKKAIQSIHSSKSSSEKIREYLSEGVDGLKKWEHANFLLLGVEFESESEREVVGKHVNENVEYEHEGFKQKGYSLKGMSGGAFFKGPKKIHSDQPRLGDVFKFFGIGLEYKNGILVKGASRHSVQEMINEMLEASL
ncbi:hypothetical protein AAZU54_24175 [Pseudomonas sp. Je.1.5.c]|uniref:hypothetical protein n=1 Tax=Pseudomonas sp. Je.1.5.c TaxID=3142839 RepID=UPI003DAA2AA0